MKGTSQASPLSLTTEGPVISFGRVTNENISLGILKEQKQGSYIEVSPCTQQTPIKMKRNTP